MKKTKPQGVSARRKKKREQPQGDTTTRADTIFMNSPLFGGGGDDTIHPTVGCELKVGNAKTRNEEMKHKQRYRKETSTNSNSNDESLPGKRKRKKRRGSYRTHQAGASEHQSDHDLVCVVDASKRSSDEEANEDTDFYTDYTDTDGNLANDTADARMLDDEVDKLFVRQTLFSLSGRLFEVGNKSVLMLRPAESVTILGNVLIRSLYGTAVVLGYRLDPSVSACSLHSPAVGRLLTVQVEDAYDVKGVRGALAEKLKQNYIDKICAAVGDEPTVLLLLSKLTSSVSDYVTALPPYTQLYENHGRDAAAVPMLGVHLTAGAETNGTVISVPMRTTAAMFCDQLDSEVAPVIAICGAKNIGKSTLARFLVNSALNKCDRIAYLEADVGQTEFTPSGCIALNVLTAPLLGPPFTHQHKPRSCCFFGTSTPGDEPQHYLRCLQYVYQKYAQMQSKPALVVNTMGWIKGLGVDLLVETLAMVRPSIVVQIHGKSPSQQMEPLTAEFVKSQCRSSLFQKMDLGKHPRKSKTTATQHLLVELDSYRHSNSLCSMSELSVRSLSAAETRDLALLAEFSRFQPGGTVPVPLSALTPHRVAWRDVAVGMCHATVPVTQIMYALNASVVALCRAHPQTMLRSSSADSPMFFSSPPICQCLGFGIVRSIDGQKKVFHVITSLPPGQLSKVNCLLKGGLNIPHQLLVQQKSKGPIPYIGCPKDVIGAHSIKPRRHLLHQTPS